MSKDKIKKLDTRAQCRDKISVWFGSRDNYYHAIREVVANAADEIINNFESGQVEVILHDDNETITITDTGRGMPIGEETDGTPNYELLFQTLFAGTKYDENEDNTTGTNGVGLTVVNHTCKLFKIVSYYNSHMHTLTYENGGEITGELTKEKCDKNLHGTHVTFKLDDEIYSETVYEEQETKDITKHFAVGSNKVKLTFKYKDTEEKFHYDNILDYFGEQIGNTSTSVVKQLQNVSYDDENEITQVDLVLTTTPDVIQESYLNLTYLKNGGTINKGVLDGVRLFANKYCRDKKLFVKGTTAFLPSDVENSISFVCNMLSNNVDFENQTKHSTDKNLYKIIAQKHATTLIELLEVENPKKFDKFIKHLLAVQKHNATNQRAKNKLKKELTENIEGIRSKVGNLVDCKKHDETSEIFIAEGKSALGAIVLARDAIFQAAFPLRGKILNCLKADYATIFKNEIIKDLVKVLGCGIEADSKNKDLENFDMNKLRYGKIIIACDADPDGFSIACLIMTAIYRLMPELLKQGKVYIAQTPLYEIKLEDDTMQYIFNESDKDSTLEKIKGKYTIARCKGLGELDAEVMSDTAMNPETRKMVHVNVDDAEKMIETLEVWMGTEVEDRKDYISKNLHEYVNVVD